MGTQVGFDQLGSPSKVAIFNLCIGNIIFVVLGLVAIGFGAYYSNNDNVLEYIASYIDDSATPEHVEALLNEETRGAVKACCVILVATGVGVVCVSLIGFCGSVARNSHFMLGYVLFLIVLVLSESAGIAAFGAFRYKLEDALQRYLQTSVFNEQYQFGKGTGSATTVLLDKLQMDYGCCGLSGYSDYSSTLRGWRKNFGNETLRVPPFCCKFKENRELSWTRLFELESARNITFRQLRTQYFSQRLVDHKCLGSLRPTVANSWKDKGCFTVFQKEIMGKLFRVLIGITASILFIEVLCLLASCVLLVDIRTIHKVERKREEKEAAMRVERDTILHGIQTSGSLAAFAMSGGLGGGGLPGTPSSMVRASMNQMAMSNMRVSPSVMAGSQSVQYF